MWQMMRKMMAGVCFLLWVSQVTAAVSVTDDEGYTVTLSHPAQRIVSLSPHATEMVYAIGAGDRLVAVTSHSDYPEQARALPVVGDFRQIDMERVLALKPDLLVVWSGGSLPPQVEKLRQAGIPVFHSRPERLADIPDNMVRLGVLAGKEAAARQVSRWWLAQLEVLKKRYRDRMPVRVFYQVSDVPLFTLNGKHIVNEVIGLCGGRNVFAGLSVLAPHVSTEAVLAADPEVIVSTRGMGAHDGLAGWRRYTMLSAVRYGNLFAIHPDWLDRPGPRMITGTEMMCKALDEARANRQAAK